MNDHKLEVEKKGEQPVNTKKAKKNVLRKTIKLKPGRKLDVASERVAFRATPAEKLALEQLAAHNNRSLSNYTRDVMQKHLKENPPPEE